MAITEFLDHKKVRKGIELNGLRQEEFSEALGISDRHIRNLLTKDINVSAALLYKISVQFGISMESLLVLREEESYK